MAAGMQLEGQLAKWEIVAIAERVILGCLPAHTIVQLEEAVAFAALGEDMVVSPEQVC